MAEEWDCGASRFQRGTSWRSQMTKRHENYLFQMYQPQKWRNIYKNLRRQRRICTGHHDMSGLSAGCGGRWTCWCIFPRCPGARLRGWRCWCKSCHPSSMSIPPCPHIWQRHCGNGAPFPPPLPPLPLSPPAPSPADARTMFLEAGTLASGLA